jgi:putative ABC transport system permease protein
MQVIKLFGESVAMAFRELRVNKLRTFLSLLGIAIGIFCVIAILAAIDSMKNNITQSLNTFGSDVVFISKWPWTFGNDYPWWKYINRPMAKYDEMKLLAAEVPGSDAVSIHFYVNNVTAKYKDLHIDNKNINAVSQDFDKVQKLDYAYGRYFAPAETQSGDALAIIGYKIYQALFPANDYPVGKEITVDGYKMTVIGVFAKEGKSIVQGTNDDVVLVPYNFMQSKVHLDGLNLEPELMVKAKPGVSMDELQSEIRGVLRSSRSIGPKEPDNFAMNQISLITNGLDSIFGVMNIIGFIIGGFALLVGGFGIANIMFVSVRERTNLIGIKKALGAKNYLILLEFLIEAIILCIVGGLFGLLLVYLITLILTQAVGFDFILSEKNIVMGIMISSFIGLISGLIPAMTASRLDPVVAIRYK